MDVLFADDDLDRLETDATFTNNLAPALVKAYRKRIQQIRAAVDERDLYASRGLRLERLKGQRQHEHSARLNDQFRLILEFVTNDKRKQVRIIGIEDYH